MTDTIITGTGTGTGIIIERARTMSRRGTVYLTGAGPGAADLLTVRAAGVLARADTVFHDALVSDDVLRLCPAGCEVVPVGKRCGRRRRGRPP
jgi:siroheme synthase